MSTQYSYSDSYSGSGSDTLYGVERVVLRFLDAVVSIVEFLLGLRLVLHFLGAGGSNAFMSWLNRVTDQLVSPFAGIFPTWVLAGGYAIELSTIFAMFAYAIIGWLIIRALALFMSAVHQAT